MPRVLCNVTSCRHNSAGIGRDKTHHCTKALLHIDDTCEPSRAECVDLCFDKPFYGMKNQAEDLDKHQKPFSFQAKHHRPKKAKVTFH